MREGRVADVKKELAGVTQKAQELQKAMSERDQATNAAMGMKELAQSHFYWEKLLAELRSVLLNVEATTQATLKSKTGGQIIDTGVWVEAFEPDVPLDSPYAGGTLASADPGVPRRTLPGVDPRDPRNRLRGPGALTPEQRRPGGRPVSANTSSEVHQQHRPHVPAD